MGGWYDRSYLFLKNMITIITKLEINRSYLLGELPDLYCASTFESNEWCTGDSPGNSKNWLQVKDPWYSDTYNKFKRVILTTSHFYKTLTWVYYQYYYNDPDYDPYATQLVVDWTPTDWATSDVSECGDNIILKGIILR